MGKKLFFVLTLLISSVAYADSYKQIQNPWTGKPDYVTKVDGMNISPSTITIQPPGTTISGNIAHIITAPNVISSDFDNSQIDSFDCYWTGKCEQTVPDGE